jgi:hypothetical protein
MDPGDRRHTDVGCGADPANHHSCFDLRVSLAAIDKLRRGPAKGNDDQTGWATGKTSPFGAYPKKDPRGFCALSALLIRSKPFPARPPASSSRREHFPG